MRWRSEDKHSEIIHRCTYKKNVSFFKNEPHFLCSQSFSGTLLPEKLQYYILPSYLQVPPVDLVNDVEVSRQQVLEEVHGPALQCLRQHGVVGVGTGSDHNVPGLDTEARATGS